MLSYDEAAAPVAVDYAEAVVRLAIIARGVVDAEERLDEVRGAYSQNALRVEACEDDVRWHRERLDAAAWMVAAVYDVRPSSAVADAALEVARRGRNDG